MAVKCSDSSGVPFEFLKRHPFPVVARFERVVAVSFAFPEAVLRPLVPASLEIDTFENLGFVTVSLVWTRKLRPAGFPTFLGHDFFLAGYRIFTRFQDDSGHRLRGLKILQSETDKRAMVWLGNLMTAYNYRRVKVQIDESGSETRVATFLPGGNRTLDITFDAVCENMNLPVGSPFKDWHTARRFAGPMPFTFSTENDGTVVIIQGSRQEWVPRPIFVKNWAIALFDSDPFREITPVLANAFAIEGVSYRWQKGRVVRPGIA